jgi:hypothetical protein
MRTFVRKITDLITGGTPPTGASKKQRRPRFTRRDLIRMESRIGGQLFGPVPKDHRREFFCLDRHTWVWYEEWIDPATRKRASTTTRYEVNENGVLKVQEGQPYKFVEGQELTNLVWAMHLYYEEVARNIYGYDPTTGKPLTLSAH